MIQETEIEATRSERKNGPCELCGAPGKVLTFHHLIPKMNHRKKRFQKQYSKSEMQTRGLYICKPCHSGIHDYFTEKELGTTYNTKEALLAHEGFARHVEWARKQK